MIEIYLSSDGKNTLHLSAENTKELAKNLPFAKQLFRKMLDEYGTKVAMWSSVMNGNGKSKEKPKQENLPHPAPICSVHGKALEYKEGPYGWFWSCTTRLENGRWCKAEARSADLRLKESISKVI